MDVVSIRELSVSAVVGAHAWERQIEQTLLIDVDVPAPVTRAAASDALPDTLDYDALAREISTWIQRRQAQLIETLAEGVASHVMTHLGLPWIRLTIWKPGAIPAAKRVGVTIERGERTA